MEGIVDVGVIDTVVVVIIAVFGVDVGCMITQKIDQTIIINSSITVNTAPLLDSISLSPFVMFISTSPMLFESS